ncbi:MAG TPA: esterase-like activity of phytase family protein [Abditibacterium sp.]|jgi:hypothetical protein
MSSSGFLVALGALVCGSVQLQAQTLVGRAILPADTFASGPTSGQAIEKANGRTPPFLNQQPVGGFSGLQRAPGGDFWVLPDNGFGARANSSDFLLRIYRLGRDFKTARGGSGFINVKATISLRDPNRAIGFPILAERDVWTLPSGKTAPVAPEIKQNRLLTGADIDPESLVAAPDGTFWIGDEFGPFLLHFDADGVLLEAPFRFEGVASPDDPLERPATLPSSRGFEGLALSSDGKQLFALLEGALRGDDARRLRIYEFDLSTKTVSPRSFSYRLEPSDKPHSIGDFAALDGNRFLVIERDSGEGGLAKFKKIFEIDLSRRDAQGFAPKRQVMDLLNIRDPARISGATTFRFPFQTIESVLPLGEGRVAVANDNNYPFSAGRRAGNSDDSEIIVLQLAPSPR